MSRNALASVAHLREIELRSSQAALAEARRQLDAEHRAAAAIEAELQREQPDAALATYGDFLARLLAARQTQAAAVARAEAALEAERRALAAAHAAEKVVDTLRARRAAMTRRLDRRREQARLDEAAAARQR